MRCTDARDTLDDVTVLVLWKPPVARATHSLWAVFAMFLPLHRGDFGFVAPPAMFHRAYSTMLSLIFSWVPQAACEALPKWAYSFVVLEFFSFDLGPTIVAHLDLAQFMMLLVIASFHELLAIPTPANGTYLLV